MYITVIDFKITLVTMLQIFFDRYDFNTDVIEFQIPKRTQHNVSSLEVLYNSQCLNKVVFAPA